MGMRHYRLGHCGTSVPAERVKANSTGLEEKTFKKAQMWETLSDTKTWLLFIFAISSNAPNGGLSTFQGLIIRGLGFSKLQTTLIQMPSGAIQFVVCIVATFVASSFENARLLTMFACLEAAWCVCGLRSPTPPHGHFPCLS